MEASHYAAPEKLQPTESCDPVTARYPAQAWIDPRPQTTTTATFARDKRLLRDIAKKEVQGADFHGEPACALGGVIRVAMFVVSAGLP